MLPQVRARVVPPWVMDRRDHEFGEERAAVERALVLPKVRHCCWERFL